MTDVAPSPAAPAARAARGKSLPSIVAAVLLVAVLLVYMFTFTVRWNEAAILTTFESAGADSVYREAGLHFKWPWPVQSVYTYDQRWRYLEYLLADQTITADRKNVVVSITAAWQIDDPLQFFKRFRTVAAGESRLKDIVRARTNDVIGRYALSDFVNTDPAHMKLPQIEAEIQALVAKDLAGGNPPTSSLGMAVAGVGFKRLGLPKAVTESVFNSMKEESNLLAENYRQQGKARAEEIRGKADQQAREILSFAGRLAANERSAGLAAAGKYASVFQQDPQFAAFLRQLEVFRQTLNKNTVFLLDGRSFGGAFSLLADGLATLSPATQPAPRPAAPAARDLPEAHP